MEKMIWSAPKAHVEQFAAGEYCVVPVCVLLGCGVSGYDDCCNHNHTGNPSFDAGNDSSGCRNPYNQMFKYMGKDENGKYVYSIIEINNKDYDDLNCYIFDSHEDQLKDKNNSVSTGSTTVKFDSVSADTLDGTTLYWNTNVGFGNYTVWMHHFGNITMQDQNHLNRS